MNSSPKRSKKQVVFEQKMGPLERVTVLNGIDLRNHDFWNILMCTKNLEIKKNGLVENFDIFGSRVWDFLKLRYLDIRGNTRLGYRKYQNFRSKTFLRFKIFSTH